jgi:hypothetical protein
MVKRSSNAMLSAKRKKQFRTLLAENSTYPLATITYHGPSPDTATKIVVGIIKTKDQAPLIQSWSGDDIDDDVESAKEISLFIKEHDVARVLTSEWVLSCPHEQGIDYPEGELCPFCPDWH